MKLKFILFICFGLFMNLAFAQEIEPNWESMAENYRVPEWFQDGKIGVWMHWGISSAADENRPHDGSHYGRRMYGAEGYDGTKEADIQTTAKLTEWHTKFYGHPSEFGYEDLIPLFKAEKWDPDGLVKFFRECGAHFIMPVATHHDNFDMYDYSQQDIRFTTKDGNLYVFVLAKPTNDIVIKTLASGGALDGEIKRISMMGSIMRRSSGNARRKDLSSSCQRHYQISQLSLLN